MWIYEKKLQYPVNIRKPDPAMAKLIITQLGGPDGEKGASDRYLNQRYAMPYPEIRALLTDIGTEEMAHEEMIATMVYQLLKGCSAQQIKAANAADYYVDHTAGVYPQGASGMPYTTAYIQSKGDPITDLSEDMAAEQKARTTYENLMRLAKDPGSLWTAGIFTPARDRSLPAFRRSSGIRPQGSGLPQLLSLQSSF